MPKYAFFRDKIVPIEEAKVSIMTHALNYGTGVFEGIRAYWNAEEEQLYVLHLAPHYERLLRSCKLLMLSIPYSVKQLCDITVELLHKESYREDAYVRPLVYKGSEVVGVRLHDLDTHLAMFCVPFGKYIESEEGANVCVSSWRRTDDNAISARGKITGSYVNAAFSKTEAMLNGFEEAIVLNQDGHVSEGSAENLFIIRDGVLTTPPVTDNILEGITRSTVIQIAKDELGLKVAERPIDRTELYIAEEAFFCGTGVQIAAIAKIDHRPVGIGRIGPITSQIRDLYFDIVRGKVEKYKHFCTSVYVK
jgi:branched-chain amino acid aminotransferase